MSARAATSRARFRAPTIATVATVVLACAACGQKPGVHIAGGAPIAVPTIVSGGAAAPGATPGPQTGGVLPTVGGLRGSQPSLGPTTTTGSSGTGTGGSVAIAGDRTGITNTTITIGLHAPATGAAPVSAEAFRAGVKLYWKWLTEVKKQTVYGRTVRVIFADDQYTPTTAVSVCNQMATSGGAFMLVGTAGADQIAACANYAAERRIPYMSPGVQDTGLSDLPTYFSLTMTYKQQIPLLLGLLKTENAKKSLNKYGGQELKIGFVRPDTPNFDDPNDELKRLAPSYGFQVKTFTVAKEGNTSEASTTAQSLQSEGVDIVFPITAPTFTTQLALRTGSNNYRPLYAGVGITNNINQEINLVCGNDQFQGALFLSPWPGWKNVMAGENDPDFKVAIANDPDAAKLNTRDRGGDIVMALWGIMKTIHRTFVAAGPNMTRESFVQTLTKGFSAHTGVFPDIAYSATNHLGARNAFVLLGDCDQVQYVTHPSYPGLRSSF